MAHSVPLPRFTPRVGGGSATFGEKPLVTSWCAVKPKKTFFGWSLALGPLLLPALLMAAALHLRVRLGHWAVPMVDHYHGHATMVIWLIPLAYVTAIPFWMMILFSSLSAISIKQRVFMLVAYLTCWFLFAVYCHLDPWRFIEWSID
jgi:hypothetical protein